MLIATWSLCVFDVREDNNSNILVMIKRIIGITWTFMSDVRERTLDLITHTLTYCACILLPPRCVSESNRMTLAQVVVYFDEWQNEKAREYS